MSTTEQFMAILAHRIAEDVAAKVIDRLQRQMSGTEKILFSMAEAAQSMGLSRSTVKNMVREREIPCVRCGTRVLIHRNDIEAWVSNNRT